MSIQEYFNDIKNIYTSFIEYIDSEDAETEEQYENLIQIFGKHDILNKHDDIIEIMFIINKVSKNHHRTGNFFSKIERILSYFSTTLKQTFKNMQVFNFFKRNKRILYYLVKEKILTIDENILNIIPDDFIYYLFNEIKGQIPKEKSDKIERDFSEQYSNTLDEIDHLCQTGENDLYICELIRNDSIEEFIIFVNRSSISLSSTIKHSIFETNPFLSKRSPTIIEYAAFYGSFQIFQYLIFNNVELAPSLWFYAIHGRNAEIIHLLEEHKIKPTNKSYEKIFDESIKCHHNEIADYIRNNLINKKKLLFQTQNETVKIIPHQKPTEIKKDKNFFDVFDVVKNFFVKKFYADNNNNNNNNDNNDSDNTNDQEDDVISSIPINYSIFNFAAQKDGNEIIDYLLQQTTEILPEAFNECINLKKIIIPDTITKIGKGAFKGCQSLKNVSLPSGIKLIDDYTFHTCFSLKSLTLPSSIESIGKCAFSLCTSLTIINIPPSVTTIGESAFSECKSIVEITLPPLLETIDAYAFTNCNSLKKIIIPPLVKTIKKYAFCSCSSIEQIDIPSSVTSIEQGAFKLCSSLKKISLPQTIELIDKETFQGCVALTEIKIPSVVSIGECAFYDCIRLRHITMPSVKIIKANAFARCRMLINLIIPDSVTHIESCAFEACISLYNVYITLPVIRISDSAFTNCSNLGHISIKLPE